MKIGPFTLAPEKTTAGIIVGALIAWVSLYILGSYITLSAVNTLFSANIPVTWETVMSVFWLTAIVNAIIGSSK
jgi:hypothetical protein